jgi:hypothetical protein
MLRNMRLLGFAAACGLSFATPGSAQTVGDTTGAIDVMISDRTGAALSGVTIRATGAGLMGLQSGASGPDGAYRFPALPPGEYVLAFSLQDFQPALRNGVIVSLGKMTSVSVTLDVEPGREEITVTGGARLLDPHTTSIAARMDEHQLTQLPGSRSMGAILAATPVIELTRFDVGGSVGFVSPPFSAYGISGFSGPTLEGINLANLNPLAHNLDYGTFEEVSVNLGAYGPEWPSPGVHTQIVTKAGGNQYRGSVYVGYQGERWQARNIDADQIARGAASNAGFSPSEANRLHGYRDLNADIGGFIRKDRAWWYFSGRDQNVAAKRVTFPTAPIETRATSGSGKVTFRAGDRGNIVVFAQRGASRQPIRLNAFLRGEAAINESEASTTDQRADGIVWKAEWNSVVTPNLHVDVRVGQFVASRAERPNGTLPRFEDLLTPEVRGGNRDWQQDLRRDQIDGALVYLTDGRFGRHHLKIGGEILRQVDTESWKHSYPGDVLHVLARGSPAEVYLFETPSRSQSGQWWYTAFANDSWQVHNRLTLNIGVRFDRFRLFLPGQQPPPGRSNAFPQSFAAVDNLIDWNVAAPRLGLSYQLTADGRTILKSGYSFYHLPPGTDLGFNVNPNSRVWWQRYAWSDVNGSRMWDPGEQSPGPLERSGGTAVESLNPDLELAFVRELHARVERELTAGLSVATGVTWRGVRQQGVRQPASWDLNAFTAASLRSDPGPTGTTLEPAGTGPHILVYELPDTLITQPELAVRNVSSSHSDYLTWEIGASRRFSGRVGVAASFAHTWNHDHANGYFGQIVRGNALPVTPNDFINTDAGGRHVFRTWTVKAHGTVMGPWGLHFTPLLRHQSGQPFGRTLLARLNYGNIRVLAEPIGTRRQDHITIVDLGLQKDIPLPGGRRLGVFLEIFNLLNSNAEQNLDWSSGPTFLRPLNIVPPRIARVGVRARW